MTVLEVPAGRVELGEDVVSAARRELREEVGYEADELIKVPRFTQRPATATKYCTSS